MIGWEQVRQRIRSGEDLHTELKRGLGDLKPIGRAIAAFANTEGGLVILGVDDRGSIVGLPQEPETVAERLTAFRHSGLNAPVQAWIGRHEHPEGSVFWIEVPRQRGFEPLAHDGRVLVHRGRASVPPSPAELQDLYNTYGYILTEERAIAAAGIEAIDLQCFHAYLRGLGLDVESVPQPDPAEDLQARGVLTEIGGGLKATLYGVLAFGRSPQSYPQTQNFWIECVAYSGIDRADEVFLAGEAKGRLDEQVERAMGWVLGLGRFESYEGLHRKDVPLVPPAALREALVNAVAHRDYAIMGSKILLEVFTDRVIVTSPGSLPNNVTVQSVIKGGHPRSRNESMATFLAGRRLMESRGRGWPIIRRKMLEFNGIEPSLDVDREARWVSAALRLKPPRGADGAGG